MKMTAAETLAPTTMLMDEGASSSLVQELVDEREEDDEEDEAEGEWFFLYLVVVGAMEGE